MTSLEKLNKLDVQTALLFEKLESETGNKLNYSKNKWSILQILYHVWLAEISSEKYIRTKTRYPETIVNTPVLAYVKAFLTKYFLKFGFTINAPKMTTEFPDKICLAITDDNKQYVGYLTKEDKEYFIVNPITKKIYINSLKVNEVYRLILTINDDWSMTSDR